MFQGFLRPGQGFQRLTVLTRKGGVSASGRPILETYESAGEILGLIMRASHGDVQQWKAREQWSQEGHPITHKIIQFGAKNRAKPTDVLEWNERGTTRHFTVQGVHNPAEMRRFTVYYAVEREDMQ